MKRLRTRLEKYFYVTAVFCYRHRLKTITVMLALFVALTFHLDRLTFDSSTESFFHSDDPAMARYDRFRDQFGRDDIIIVAVKPDNLFDISTLKKITALHRDIEENVPYIDDMTSMVNIRHIQGKENELIVEDLLAEIPATTREMADLKTRVLSNPFYQNTIVSEDGKLTAIIIKVSTYAEEIGDVLDFSGIEDDPGKVWQSPEPRNVTYLSDVQATELVEALANIVDQYQSPEFKIYTAGAPIVDIAVKNMAGREMALFSGLSILMIACILFILFHRISGVVLPVTIVFLSMASMMGIMAWCNTPITIVTQILSSFILVVGVGDSVHILAIFFLRLKETGDKEKAVAQAMQHSGLAVTMTSLTTAGGLLSFTVAEIKPVADLGIFGALGVGLAFLYTVLLLPALINLFPIKPGTVKAEKSSFIDQILSKIAEFAVNRHITIIAVSALLVAVSGVYITNIRFSHNILEMLPDALDVKKATRVIDRDLKGSVSLEVVIDTGKENGLHDPGLLSRLDKSANEVEKMRYKNVFAGKAWSVTNILKETHKALNENRDDFYAIPDNRDLISQEFLLFENSGADDLEEVVDSQFSMARFTIKAPFENAMEYGPFIDRVYDHFNRQYPDADITVTGIMALFTKTVYNVMQSAVKSYVVAFFVVSILMFVFLANPVVAGLSLLPNLIPIVLILGIMGFWGIDMDSTNLLIGSIVLGLVVDDTIHFMYNFSRYHDQTRDTAVAIKMTLLTAGRAIFVTSLVLTCGFFVFMLSSMKNIYHFGLLTGIAIMLALLADYFLSPALITLARDALNRRVGG